jgi:hypothetical protein
MFQNISTVSLRYSNNTHWTDGDESLKSMKSTLRIRTFRFLSSYCTILTLSSHLCFPLSKYSPRFIACASFVQFIIFLYASYSFIHIHFLLIKFTLSFVVSGQLNSICLTSSLPLHRGHLYFSNPLLISLSFQTPAFIQTNPLLLFLEYNSLYSSLPHLCSISW